jgi:site-specific DNA-methyltransferase (adenine-specific)
MTSITLHRGDNRLHLRRLIAAGVRVHSVVCDPPYGLTSITKRFGAETAAPAKFGVDGAFARASSGFMRSKWDATGIERDPEFWGLIHDILLPGGYVLAFSSPRTGHWQACAMELAGFIMHPFLGWVYGQGFPKDSDAQRAIDRHLCPLPGRHYETSLPDDRQPDDHLCPHAQEGMEWEGWGYGTQSMKPALEPIYIGQKPFAEKTGALNLLRHGVGAINIDGCRAGDRHPANLLHDGSVEVTGMFPAKAGAASPVKGSEPSSVTNGIYGKFSQRMAGAFHADSGSAARFFNSFPLDADPLIYHGKATKADRAGSKHPTVKPVGLMRWLCRLVTPAGGVVLDPFAGSGTTAEAARQEGFSCILMEAEEQFVQGICGRFNLELPPAELSVDDLLSLTEEPISCKTLLGQGLCSSDPVFDLLG